jgi:hypothetical protein
MTSLLTPILILSSLYGGGSLQVFNISDVATDLVGYRYYIVYKLGLAMIIYHGLISLALVGVKDESDDRSVIQDAFWPAKLIFKALAILGCLWLPRFLVDFLYYPMVVAALAFSIMQSVIFVDVAYGVTGVCLDNGGAYMAILLLGSLLLYVLIGTVATFMCISFVDFSARSIIVGFVIATVSLSVCSVLPVFRKGNDRSGLFQASILGSLSILIVCSAIISNAENQMAAQSNKIIDIYSTIANVFNGIFCAIAIIAAAYSGGSGKGEESHEYNYSLFHAIFMLGSGYVVALLTGWLQPIVEGHSLSFSEPYFAFFAKIFVAVVINLIYGWTLVAPIVLPDRTFDF